MRTSTLTPSAVAVARRARLDDMAIYALSEATGLELSEYRSAHIEECLRRAIEREGTADIHGLIRLVRGDARAAARFRQSVAVSVTGMFRDPQQFDVLEPWLEQLPARSGGGAAVWSAGCANGAELLSAGMLLERHGLLDGARLLGSDILEENLALARAGGPEPDAVPDPVRRAARWERRDLVRDDLPPGRWSLVLCRNVAIYLVPRTRDALHARLAAALAPGGLLLLGRSETLTEPRRLGFEPVGPHLFRKAC
jgi:chemotaxis protein methyltransferase CheR